MKKNGALVISLDIDTYWGMIDKISLDKYKNNLLGERKLIPKLLELFKYYKIHATWAVVGFLFFEDKNELINSLPKKRPDYENKKVSPYPYVDGIGQNEKEDPFHYAPTLIKLIASYPDQEIGTHTFSHYYCLERGQDEKSFRADLEAAIKISKKNNFNPESLIFPRNQVNDNYLSICQDLGIKIFRGNERSFIYKPLPDNEQSFLRRAIRFLDCYINISGHNCYSPEEIRRVFPFNVPSSRFLRPSFGGSKMLDFLQMRRIFSDLKYAAENGLVFHLWWHPHNFGLDPEKNITILKKIFGYFSELKDKYGMESLNMEELAGIISKS